jgi:hypothetical protein
MRNLFLLPVTALALVLSSCGEQKAEKAADDSSRTSAIPAPFLDPVDHNKRKADSLLATLTPAQVRELPDSLLNFLGNYGHLDKIDSLHRIAIAEEQTRRYPSARTGVRGAASPPASSVTNLDQTPSWYRGSKPWSEIGKEGRITILRGHAAYEAQQAAAAQPGSGENEKAAADGRQLINKIVQQYGLDPVYREPDTFGPRMVIWLPSAAWQKLSRSQKEAIEAFMSSNYANWGIGVGRIRGRDVLYDDLVVQR